VSLIACSFLDLLTALYADTSGRLELRAWPPADRDAVARKFFAPTATADIEAFCRQHADDELYFGVALLGKADNGTLHNCVALPALFTDIDSRRVPRQRRARGSAPSRSRPAAWCRPAVAYTSTGC